VENGNKEGHVQGLGIPTCWLSNHRERLDKKELHPGNEGLLLPRGREGMGFFKKYKNTKLKSKYLINKHA
jgi:hypothetical protein